MRKKIIIVSSAFVLLLLITLFFFITSKPDVELDIIDEVTAEEESYKRYGILVEEFNIIDDTVRKGDFLGTILNRYGISAQQVDKIAKISSDTFNVTRINVGRLYSVFYDTTINGIPKAKIFVYENNQITYTIYDFREPDTIKIERFDKHVDTIAAEASGTIRHSLWQTMIDNGYSWELALALSQTFAWTVDFYSLQPGNWFKVIYDELYVEERKVGLKGITAGIFYHGGKELWAIPFVQDSVISYFDTLGNSMRKTFLQAPLEYTRVSSRYSTSRMHPIFNQAREHLAVDFAAPMGTPVYASSDGTIATKTFGTGAGYYIVIKHNSVYTTVYMHLSRFGKFNVGDRVSQGDIIGYVGSTGWSTGPHLHYEVHENGSKIDPLKFEPPPAEPVDSVNMDRFNVEKRYWIDKINEIELK